MYVHSVDKSWRAGADAEIAVNWNDAHRRVLKSYREWIRSVCFPKLNPPIIPIVEYTWHLRIGGQAEAVLVGRTIG